MTGTSVQGLVVFCFLFFCFLFFFWVGGGALGTVLITTHEPPRMTPWPSESTAASEIVNTLPAGFRV